jgi:hypothetical protein
MVVMRVRLLGASTAVPHAVTPQGILLERPGVGTDVAVPFVQSSGFGVAYHDATVASIAGLFGP